MTCRTVTLTLTFILTFILILTFTLAVLFLPERSSTSFPCMHGGLSILAISAQNGQGSPILHFLHLFHLSLCGVNASSPLNMCQASQRSYRLSRCNSSLCHRSSIDMLLPARLSRPSNILLWSCSHTNIPCHFSPDRRCFCSAHAALAPPGGHFWDPIPHLPPHVHRELWRRMSLENGWPLNDA